MSEIAAKANEEEPAAIPSELLALLRCPESGQRLCVAPPELLQQLRSRGTPIEAALVREDRRVAYPIQNGIPILLSGEAIPLQ